MRRGVRPSVIAAIAVPITFTLACLQAPGPNGAALSGAASGDPDAEVRDFRIHELAARVRTMPPGVDRDYFAGILASRAARSEEALRLLNGVLPVLRETQPQRAAVALEALAETYSATYRYRDASRIYEELAPLASHLPQPVDDDVALARILADAPAQTIAWTGPVRLKTSRNPIGSVNGTLTVGGTPVEWLLDTGANYSVVSRSLARQLGLTPLAGAAMVGSGVTGLKSALEVGIVPRVEIGGATVSHVVAIILEDANLRVGPEGNAYQIHAILGYPVLRALGRVTFTRQGEFLAGEAAEQARTSAPMFMRGLTPAVECEVAGEPLLFTFDTGASSSNFSVRYYERFRQDAKSWRTSTVESGGAGGTVRREMFVQPRVDLKVGGANVALKDVTIFSTAMNAGIDVLFGNLGQDFVDGFDSFTLDFSTMAFSFGAPIRAIAVRP